AVVRLRAYARANRVRRRYERVDAPPEARGSGHGDADYYNHVAFRDAVRGERPLEFDVYRALDTAAPAIRAAESIARQHTARRTGLSTGPTSAERRAAQNQDPGFPLTPTSGAELAKRVLNPSMERGIGIDHVP